MSRVILAPKNDSIDRLDDFATATMPEHRIKSSSSKSADMWSFCNLAEMRRIKRRIKGGSCFQNPSPSPSPVTVKRSATNAHNPNFSEVSRYTLIPLRDHKMSTNSTAHLLSQWTMYSIFLLFFVFHLSWAGTLHVSVPPPLLHYSAPAVTAFLLPSLQSRPLESQRGSLSLHKRQHYPRLRAFESSYSAIWCQHCRWHLHRRHHAHHN